MREVNEKADSDQFFSPMLPKEKSSYYTVIILAFFRPTYHEKFNFVHRRVQHTRAELLSEGFRGRAGHPVRRGSLVWPLNSSPTAAASVNTADTYILKVIT